MRRQDKKEAKNQRDAAAGKVRRMREVKRQEDRRHQRKTSLRVLEHADVLRDVFVGNRSKSVGAVRPARWVPSEASAAEVLRVDDHRMVIGVHADGVPDLLHCIAPQFLTMFHDGLAMRRSAPDAAPRGAGVILADAVSSSSPHRDGEDSLLLAVSGQRLVWFCPPSGVDAKVPVTQPAASGPVYLPCAYDPSKHPPASMVGVQWREPIVLQAGDAVWIQRGWWHCIEADAGSVGLPVEVVHGFVRGNAPRVFRGLATRHSSGRARNLVSRCPGWGSPSCVRRLFALALAA